MPICNSFPHSTENSGPQLLTLSHPCTTMYNLLSLSKTGLVNFKIMGLLILFYIGGKEFIQNVTFNNSSPLYRCMNIENFVF
jgi:hypothetical protein